MTDDCKINPYLQQDIRNFLNTRLEEIEKKPANEDLRAEIAEIQSNIKNLNWCKPGRRSGKRKKTARNIFIGDCMRKEENGGHGLDMKTCSIMWNAMDDSEKAQYAPENQPEEKPAAEEKKETI